jgi:hypothetical protein
MPSSKEKKSLKDIVPGHRPGTTMYRSDRRATQRPPRYRVRSQRRRTQAKFWFHLLKGARLIFLRLFNDRSTAL